MPHGSRRRSLPDDEIDVKVLHRRVEHFLDRRNAGPRDQRRREDRADVLCYTTEPLREDLTVAGALAAEVWLRTSHPYVDVFVRLCDVNPSGKSRNLSDGLVRLDPHEDDPSPDGTRRIRISMWPTAVTFRRGHRVRLQVSGGATMEKLEQFGSQTPLGRAGQPAELGSIYVQLAADDGSFATGQIYGAAGGSGQP